MAVGDDTARVEAMEVTVEQEKASESHAERKTTFPTLSAAQVWGLLPRFELMHVVRRYNVSADLASDVTAAIVVVRAGEARS